MGAGALEDCEVVCGAPDKEPVADVSNVAFKAALPFTAEGMHVMATLQFLNRFGRVLQDKLDDLTQRRGVPAAAFQQLDVTLEGWGEFRFQHGSDSQSGEHFVGGVEA